ncbi:hypothetical protein [Amycolatopsis sp. YIM 10]|uniref:hypothetical protein n=1 Tax=Amycolatopsis sp. YIM 10 TaxID=2653857 RepID=UPI00129011C1|nr:hypothetical protein [Amycolatopsis sp. YIM 10]QFU90976.1 hypothetical protein YIM_29020 [Amycolatopsis sp. YIM 10]
MPTASPTESLRPGKLDDRVDGVEFNLLLHGVEITESGKPLSAKIEPLMPNLNKLKQR